MKQRALLLTLAIATAMSFALSTAQADAPFVIPVVATDDSGNTRTVAVGLLLTANLCVDTTDQFGGYQEYELPPVPPTNVFDARLDSPSFVTNTPCYGQGTAADFRQQIGPGQVDSFLVRTQDGTGGRPIHLTWPAGLSLYCDSLRMIDAFGGFLINVDMLTSTNFDLMPGMPAEFYIIMYAKIDPFAPTYFLTVTPDTLISKDPLKGKFWKAVKRVKPGKPIIAPNWANLLQETVVQGGFADSTSESDAAGGMVVGVSHMENIGGKWKAKKDSAKVRAWGRFTKWDPIKGGKSHDAIQKTLEDKTGKHIGIARGFDSTGNDGDLKRKRIVKQMTKFVPKKPQPTGNRLFAELVAFKVNIAASAMGKTPAGFGDLQYNMAGSPFDGMTFFDISAKIDTAMTYWEALDPDGDGGPFYDSAYAALNLINKTFVGSILDTITWMTGSKLSLNGTVDAQTIPYVIVPAPFRPTRIAARNNFTEEDASFSFEDEDEDMIDGSGVPVAMKLYQNFPNPFNPSTTIAFRLGEASNVTVKIYNLLGQEMATLLSNEELEEGIQTLDFSASAFASGVYFYRVDGQNVETGEQIVPAVGKMMLLK